jgi:hypothetical protein
VGVQRQGTVLGVFIIGEISHTVAWGGISDCFPVKPKREIIEV